MRKRVKHLREKCQNLTHLVVCTLIYNKLYCVRLCVGFLFLRKIFARKEERMGIEGRTDWEEWKNESGGKEERFGRRGRVPAVVLESTSAGTRKYHRWYFPWHFHVFRRRLHLLPEKTTSSAGEHPFDSPSPTLIGFTPFRLEKRAIGQKSYAKNRNLTHDLTHQNSLSINE